MQVDTLWVRHGESTWNRAGLMQGQTSWPPLTARGARQAQEAAAELRRHGPVRVVSSDLERASQTALVIASQLGLPIDHTPLLRERSWGVFEGRPIAEGHRAEFALSPSEKVPQGESRDEVAERLCRLLPVFASEQRPIVAVTHGDVIREAVRMWAKTAHACDLDNGGILGISIELSAVSESERLKPPFASVTTAPHVGEP